MDRDTDRWVRSDEARTKLRDLLDEIAHDGARIYVLRYDKPAAVLVPVDWYEDAEAAWSTQLEQGTGETK
jgi:PHD/YefM family antitoxin component YafN of YafNO toxin-antitoxin module